MNPLIPLTVLSVTCAGAAIFFARQVVRLGETDRPFYLLYLWAALGLSAWFAAWVVFMAVSGR